MKREFGFGPSFAERLEKGPRDGRTPVYLAPADIEKEGPSFDLPIALGMTVAKGDIDAW